MTDDTIERPRGLRAVLQPPREDTPSQSETIRAGEAITDILRILEGVPDRQVGNVFAAVQAIRKTAAGESIEAIREGFHALDRQRMKRENGKRRGWFRR
mgnify:FL=1